MYAASPALAASPPVLITLFTGLLIAFAVQLLLTTFGVAAGITAIGYLPSAQPSDETQDAASSDSSSSEKNSSDGTASKLGLAIGVGTLFTVNTVLFTACFLAVKLSFASSPTVGAVLGIVIWSGYFLVLLWFSSKAAGSLLGVLVGAVSAGVQGLMSTVTTALGRKTADMRPAALGKRMAATEANLTTLKEQVEATDRNLEATLREYVQTIQPPKPDLQSIRQTVASVLADSGLSTVAKTGLSRIDRQTLVELVSSRTDFSTRDVNEIVDQLEGVWQEVVGAPDAIADLTTFFQAASPETLTPEAINDRLQQLLATQPHPAAENSAVTGANVALANASMEPKQLIKQLVRIVRDRVDLSDLDVGSILQQLQTFARASSEPDASTQPETTDRDHPSTTTIKADVEDYLLNAYPWNLTRKTVQAEFSDVLYDPEANPEAVRQQLSTLDRNFFVTLLEQRDDLSPAKVQKIADRLAATQQAVLDTLELAITEAPLQAFSQQVADYLQSASKAALQPPQFQKKLQAMLQRSAITVDRWHDYLHYLSRDRLETLLREQQTWDQTKLDTLIAALETSRDRLLADVKARQIEAQKEVAVLWEALGNYVSDRTQKLTARTIQRQLKTLVKASKIDLFSLRPYLSSFDRTTAAQWLDQQPTLTAKQRQRVLLQLEKAWNHLYEAPETAATAAANGKQALKLLQDYVQTIDLSTVSATDLPQNLLHYLKQHHIGVEQLSQLLPSDWKPLLEYVQQRPDLTEAQRDQLQQQVQRSLYAIVKLPRRLALRSKRQVQRWQDHLSDYLRYAEQDDLSTDRLPHSIQRLLDHVQTTAGTSSDEFDWQHLTALSRDRLVTLLSERDDMTQDNIHQIAEQVETTLQQTISHAQTVQQQAQEAIAHTLETVQHYITSLPLPELDYDRIKHDLQHVLVDPRAGLESLSSSLGDTLREQLSTLNRETFATLISTRDDLSATFTQQITDRLDAARLGAIAHIETIQQAAKQRLEDLQQQAQHQANETRKAVAIAAWWLFATALSAAFTSAIAGALAVGGLEWVQQMVRVLNFEV